MPARRVRPLPSGVPATWRKHDRLCGSDVKIGLVVRPATALVGWRTSPTEAACGLSAPSRPGLGSGLEVDWRRTALLTQLGPAFGRTVRRLVILASRLKDCSRGRLPSCRGRGVTVPAKLLLGSRGAAAPYCLCGVEALARLLPGRCGEVVTTCSRGPASAWPQLFVLVWAALVVRAHTSSVGEWLAAWVLRDISLEAAAAT